MQAKVIHLPWLLATVALFASLCSSIASGGAESPSPPMPFGMGAIPEFHPPVINATSPRTAELLWRAVEGSETSRRVELAHDLGACKLPAAAPALVSMLSDSEPVVRAEAARSLAAMGDHAAAARLEPLYRDPDARVRREAILAGGALGDFKAFATGLHDSDENVQAAACALASTPEQIADLCGALGSLPPNARLAALRVVARPEAAAHWDAVATYLKGTSSEQYWALKALGAMRVKSSVDAVTPLLADPLSTNRREALAALDHILPTEQRQRLALKMLSDPDTTVRSGAAQILSEVPTDEAIPALLQQFQLHDASLNQSVREALVATRPKSAPAVAKLLTADDPSQREAASYVLGRLKSHENFAQHIALLRDRNWRCVSQAARSLGQIGDVSAGPALVAVVGRMPELSDQNDSADGRAALGAIRDAIIAAAELHDAQLLQVVSPFIPQQMTCPPEIRAAAIFAWGLIGDANDSATRDELFSIYGDRDEPLPLKVEALKALGNLRVASSAGSLASIAQNCENLQLRWIAHWAADRITGTASPFTLAPSPWVADVSVTDLGGAAQAQSISAVLPLGPSYLPGAWTPVRMMLRNPSADDITGYASLAAADKGGPATIHIPCAIPAHSTVRLTAYGYFPSSVGRAGPSAAGAGVSTVEWVDSAGRRIARGELVGAPCSSNEASPADSVGLQDTLFLCISDATNDVIQRDGPDPADFSAFAHAIGRRFGFSVTPGSIRPADAPRQSVGYAACRFVLLACDPDSLDEAQRTALLDHLRSGGILLVCGRQMEQASWLAGSMPAFALGDREKSALHLNGAAKETPLTAPASLVEATELSSGACAVASDGGLIQAAYRPVGLGRVVFTSFPVNALSLNDKVSAELWSRLLDLGPAQARGLGDSTVGLLGRIAGIPAAPFALPLGVVCGYCLVILGFHLFAGAPARPRAFAATLILATAGAGVLVVARAVHTSVRRIHGARITTLDLGPHGGGRQQELLAFVGDESPTFGFRAAPGASLRAADSSEPDPVELTELPFAAPRAGVHTTEIRRAWLVERALDANVRLKAIARFDASGLKLSIENGLGGPLDSPVFIWGSAWPLDNIPNGQSIKVPLRRNAAGDFGGGGLVRSDSELLRSQILSDVCAPPSHPSLSNGQAVPVLAGWLANAPEIAQAPDGIQLRGQALVRVPIEIERPSLGSPVYIDGAYCQLIQSTERGLPYDPTRREWVPGVQSGQWLVGFAPPPGIGPLHPLRVTLKADVSAPTETVSFLRAQCTDGVPASNAAGAVAALWEQPIAAKSATFDCTPSDYDQNGIVWLLLRVQSTSASPSPWFFRQLELSYTATAVSSSGASPPAPH